MKKFKTPLSIRGDSLYCPLSFSLDAYWGCTPDCHHCYFRRLNATWGNDIRVTDPEDVYRKLSNGLRNASPRSALAHAMANKNTIRVGNKSDPLQPIEKKYRITRKLIRVLTKLEWSFVIQTRFTSMLMEYEKWIMKAHEKGLVTLMPIISPGLADDWMRFEKSIPDTPLNRMRHARYFIEKGVPVGVNGEPFIPGVHRPIDFENTVELLKEHGIERYNTYNFHFNAFVAKRLHAIGVNIEKIWYYNQDKHWKPILQELLQIAEKHDMILGCPDFVNTGPKWKEKANTCCGIDVPNPTTFNTHYFKKMIQEGKKPEAVLKATYDGVGDYDQGEAIVRGKQSEFYTLRDAGVLK